MHQRAGGPDRNRLVSATEENQWQPPPATAGTERARRCRSAAENPLHTLIAEQIEAIGRELDELHEQVKADLGDRDARYIRSMIALQRRLALLGRGWSWSARAGGCPGRSGTATLGLAKILENMEIGHNVMHGQWDWMNDPVINSRAWDWDTASTAEAWRHSHNYIHHTYTNILGKDRDLGYEIMRIDPEQNWYPFYLLQPLYNILLMMLFEWGVAFHDLDFEAIRTGRRHGEGPQGAEGDRRQGPHADRQGLHRVAADQRAVMTLIELGVIVEAGPAGGVARAAGPTRCRAAAA